MKTCGYCGHKNLDPAIRCDECGWALPKALMLAKAGRFLRLGAAAGMVLLAVFHLGVLLLPGVTEGGGHDVWALYSWLSFLVGMGIGASLFWLGDYLRRTY